MSVRKWPSIKHFPNEFMASVTGLEDFLLQQDAKFVSDGPV